jgi:hypothetical protein
VGPPAAGRCCGRRTFAGPAGGGARRRSGVGARGRPLFVLAGRGPVREPRHRRPGQRPAGGRSVIATSAGVAGAVPALDGSARSRPAAAAVGRYRRA